MKLALAVFISTLALAAGEPQGAKATTKSRPVKAMEIPAGAVEREQGRFYYTAPDGKKWIYSRTPFGITRAEDKAAGLNEPKAIDPMAGVKVIEDGDTVRFERPGPFGVYKWQKKKQDLDEKEKVALQKSQDSAAKQDK